MPSRCTVLSAVAYLALSLYAMSGVLEAPATLLLGPPAEGPGRLLRTDQNMVLSVVTHNARLFSSRPWDLFADGNCYPTPLSHTLGEHMFGNGLLAAIPHRLTGEPILAYNVLLVLRLWIPALAMYALSLHFTKSPPAAFVAGLVFGLSRSRLRDPVHPYAYGDLWTPLILLFLHFLFTRRDWKSAIGLALFVSLQMMESLYAVLACTLVAGVYAVHLAISNWRRIPELVPKLLLCALTASAMGAWIFLPYLETARTWNVLSGRSANFSYIWQFAPGESYFIGFVVGTLALLGVADRLRRSRPVAGDDPRLAILLGGFLALWSAVYGLKIPFLDVGMRSPLYLLRDVVPGLSSVRVLAAVYIGAFLAAAFLAGYGVLLLVERLRSAHATRAALAAALSLAFLLEVFAPPIARRSWGAPLDLAPFRARPPEEDIDLVVRTADGAVLDLPRIRPNLLANAGQLLLASFHGHPTGACYNSFRVPVQDQIVELAKQLPAKPAAEALSALGFRTLFVHLPLVTPSAQKKFDRKLGLQNVSGTSPLEPIGATDRIRAYRLPAAGPLERSFDVLAASTDAEPRSSIRQPTAAVRFEIANPGAETFRHPEPIEPSNLVVRWVSDQDGTSLESSVRTLLPLAIAARGKTWNEIELPVPVAPGRYDVSIARASTPDHVLGSRRVEVLPADVPERARKREAGRRKRGA
ncbi:MAG: hypothetical protein FJ144_14780 [Deltaproteobacteria bacterium]|nr:hypothetical protein [Deltaproteobacteria bacterium]